VAEGDAPAEILYLAQKLPCDLIVMGTHGRTGLSRFLTGSVAEEVLQKAGCPVLAVKTPLQEAPAANEIAPAKPGDVVDVRPLAAAKTKTLVKADELEIIRLIIPAGRDIPVHKAAGTVVFHCLEGRVPFTALGKKEDLQAGELMYLPTGEPHSIRSVEDASLLLTIVRPKR
jgi:quercetin dioxygenase-like cupin family protein